MADLAWGVPRAWQRSTRRTADELPSHGASPVCGGAAAMDVAILDVASRLHGGRPKETSMRHSPLHRSSPVLILLASLAIAGCVAEPDDSVAENQEAIIMPAPPSPPTFPPFLVNYTINNSATGKNLD